jgi:pimeloyl-ACP methyl ester carboxylesterase
LTLIHHSRQGSGKPPLVFIHGFGCARSDWDAVVAHFGASHETIAVDLGGHGTTPGTTAHRRLETHGEDVATLLGELDVAPAVIFGHSMGCRVAMEAALRAPAHAKALVLVDGSRMGMQGSTAHIERGRKLEELGYATFVRDAFEQMFAPDYKASPTAKAVIERAIARDPAICGPLFVDIGRYDAENMERVLSSIKVPLLAIQTTYSDGMKRVSLKTGESTPYLDFIRQKVATAKIEVIPETGHFPQLERPAETNAIIEAFLRDLA